MILLATALYWIAIGALSLAGAAGAALLLRRRGRQERGAWAIGLAASLLLPLLLTSIAPTTTEVGASTEVASPVTVIDLAPIRVGVAESPGAAWIGPAALMAWGVLSGLLLLRFLASLRLVHRIRDRASRTDLGVRVAEDHGPAVVGFLRPEVLVPRWVIRLPPAQRDWILRHESEHVRGRDPLLLAIVIASRIALPWNPVVWLFGRSLRTAIETDCDRRTLNAGGDPRAYGEALLMVAGGPRDRYPLPAMAPAFAERHVALDHRIETLTRPRRSLGAAARLALAGIVLVAAAAACEVPAPTQAPVDEESFLDVPVRTVEGETGPAIGEAGSSSDSEAGPPPPPAASDEGRYMRSETPGEVPTPEVVDVPVEDVPAPPAAARLEDGPRFIPYDTPPRMTNNEEVQAVLSREYPPVLKQAGIGGVVNVWLLIDDEGVVEQTEVNESSGFDALDTAALRTADAMTFEPARNRDRATAVWVSIPITFAVGRL